jgi:hypothetical protein
LEANSNVRVDQPSPLVRPGHAVDVAPPIAAESNSDGAIRRERGIMRDAVPDDVRRFILTSVSSVPYLEALLLLRSAPDDTWDALQLARRLYISEKLAAELLSSLNASGVAQGLPGDPPRFHYSPGSPELRAILDRLADIYATQLKEVTNIIHSTTEKKAQKFADAFRLRQDP